MPTVAPLTHETGTLIWQGPSHYRPHRGTVAVQYQRVGPPEAPAVVVQGGISAWRSVLSTTQGPGWWDAMVGPGRAIDIDRYQIVSIDWLTPQDWTTEAPEAVSSRDQAQAIAHTLTALGIERAQAFVGASYGAMVGLAFLADHGSRVERGILLAGAHRPHPLATAQRAIQRDLVRWGQSVGQVEQALNLARQLAMTTYRGADEFAQRFARGPEWVEGRFQFPVEAYLQHAGQQFAQRFCPQRFLALSESIDLHDVAPEGITAPVHLIGFPSDRLVPLADLCELQRRLPQPASLEVIDSRYGHDAFLKESGVLTPVVRQALEGADVAPRQGVRRPRRRR